MSLIANETVEKAIAGLVLKRNAYSDTLLDADAEDEAAFVSAAHRKEILAIARRAGR